MQLDTFTSSPFSIDEIMPNQEVDWEDAPLPYKLYRNLPIIPLSLEIPLSLPNSSTTPTLDEISHYLWCSFGFNPVMSAK